MNDITLLREFVENDSQSAFETLVSRHANLVYSAALRQVRYPHLAEEVTQAVFIILAQKAGRISGNAHLTGWLFKTTRFVALAEIRASARRQQQAEELQMESEFSTGDARPSLGTDVSITRRGIGKSRGKRSAGFAVEIL